MIWAAFDIGTNSVKLLVAEVSLRSHPPGGPDGPRKLFHGVQITRMGEGLARTGRLGEAGMERALEVLRGLREHARSYDPQGMSALGMEAFRRASNGEDFARRIEAELGMPMTVLTGVEEARLGREGVLRALGAEERWLLVDIGGGSTELSFVGWETSVPLGAVIVTEEMLPSDPPDANEMAAMRATLASRFASALEGVDVSGARMVGVGGTVTTYAAILQELAAYDGERVHGYVMTSAQVREVTDRLAALPIVERRAVVGLMPDRAPVIVGGGAILESAMAAAGAERLVVSEANLLHAFVVREALASEGAVEAG